MSDDATPAKVRLTDGLAAWWRERKRRRYWTADRQLENLRNMVQGDHRWLAHDKTADALTTRYLAALEPDWYRRVHTDASNFRREIGLEPVNTLGAAINNPENLARLDRIARGEPPQAAPAVGAQVDRRVMPLVERLQTEADLCRNETADDVAALLDEAASAIDYLSAVRQNRAPRWVPACVRLDGPVRGDYPIGHTTLVEADDHDCECNRWGAVSVRATNGQMLGLRPGEFEVLTWRRNERAA